MPAISGSWDGRFIDVGGFEGTLQLYLKEGRGKVDGRYVVSVLDEHGPIDDEGGIKGTVDGERVQLTFSSKQGQDVRISFVGQVFACRNDGLGIKGVYDIAARRFSPLGGGVLVAQRSSSKQSKWVITAVSRPAELKAAAK